ncbi:hypothetical protein THAOC_36656 [Thalassiosira oceanica]|uniref:Uncharacterized protein n=1 Tax=Thalassiosira oceanica TaxID=159749 RepID=K0RE52_THAOC|nr:hypothetical protein THAOC_36656 [Thalassiosira oceanica]|eukprot:EJK44777.1 hypothetical protein THAOC_36656 [Thalassiosira oceanica]
MHGKQARLQADEPKRNQNMKQRPKKTEDVLEDLILVCLARSLEVLGRQIDLPDVITAGGRPYKTAHIVEGLRHRGSFWTGQWTLPCFRSTLGVPSTGSMQRSWPLRPLKNKTRAGLKVGSGVAENHEEETRDQDNKVGESGETETKDDRGRWERWRISKEDRQEED